MPRRSSAESGSWRVFVSCARMAERLSIGTARLRRPNELWDHVLHLQVIGARCRIESGRPAPDDSVKRNQNCSSVSRSGSAVRAGGASRTVATSRSAPITTCPSVQHRPPARIPPNLYGGID
jgi:hypothetical protein